MGKRKSSSKPVVKAKVKLDTTFDCLFCNHEKSVAVKMYELAQDVSLVLRLAVNICV